MYDYIEGIYKGIKKDSIIIDNSGIGYRILTSGNSMYSMPVLGSKVKLYVEQIVRQDFIGLYGFTTEEELEMFLKLININGIGSKAALSLLSINTADTLKKAIYYSDESVLVKAPGIGKKTAQRIILELKDRITILPEDEPEQMGINVICNDKIQEVTDALASLGFDDKSISKVLDEVSVDLQNDSIEFIIKECLKSLMR